VNQMVNEVKKKPIKELAYFFEGLGFEISTIGLMLEFNVVQLHSVSLQIYMN
jgi:hypothetical protein